MRAFLSLLLMFFCVSGFSQSIEPHVICSTNEVSVVQYSQLKASYSDRTYHVPIVFHVFDPSNPEKKITG